MRISTSLIYQRATQGFQQQQSNLSLIQQQISSGLKYQRPSDNPAAMARSLDLQQVLSRTAQYQENAKVAENRLVLEETTLNGAAGLLQRVRELAVRAGNGALARSDRMAIASEVRERFDELRGLSNTIDGHGDYLFAGHQGQQEAVQTSSIGQIQFARFSGDEGAREMQISSSRRVQTADSGLEVFFRIPAGEGISTRADTGNSGSGEIAPGFVYDSTQATGDEYRIDFTAPGSYDVVNVSSGATLVSGASYTPGHTIQFDGLRTALQGAPADGDSFTLRSSRNQDVFATLHKFVTALESNTDTDVDEARYDASVAVTLGDLDSALGRVDEVRTRIGGRLNMLDTQRDENAAYQLHTERTLSDIRDLDYAEAISRLQNDSFVLQAAQQSFARIEGNTLFNYL